MTKQETLQVLAILKAAYPNSYKNLDKDTANATANIWATQFINIPASVVMIAVNKLISTNTFPPSIGEVKERIRSLYFEAWQMLDDHEKATKGVVLYEGDEPTKWGTPLDEKTLAMVKDILRVCEPMRTQARLEPTLGELLSEYNTYLTGGGQEQKKIGG